MAENWSDYELAEAIKAYNEMMRRDAERKPYSKREVYSKLSKQFGRTEQAFEYRMQNISAVLDELGEPWLPGLKPAVNVGKNVRERIKVLLTKTTKQRHPSSKVQHAYKEKLPAIRDWLIEVARSQGTVRYGEVMKAFGIGFRNIRRVMDYLGHESENLDEPILTALIVNSKGRCSIGFEKEFGISDDAGEREKLFHYWTNAINTILPVEITSKIEVKAARFVSIEVRPDQAAFRREVFLACKGMCVISGCDVVRALDAAHKRGRDWRQGHNRAEDGYLLRKDLHALYDSGLLHISDEGTVNIDASIKSHYGDLDGKQLF
jgi:hypothetical protein